MRVTLAAGETRDIVVQVGAAASEAEARVLLARYRTPSLARDAIQHVQTAWTNRLGVIRVETPESSFDALINTWMLYQTTSSRLWARTGLYQSSGAYGFRDQLQDAMALLYAEPALARAQILRAAARQFTEGMCNTGGIRIRAVAYAPDSPMIWCGCRISSTTTSA